MDKKNVLIGLSWVYANGRLHIGHVASSLPADVLARYHRLIGNDVSFITGSDCYGTPILVSALNEKISPTELAEKYHRLLKQDFEKLGFTFDNYSKTMGEYHNRFVMDFHDEMYKGDYIYEKSAPQLFCEKCNKFLPDRYVEGICPHCKKNAKGDSCDHCGKILEPEDLHEPKCKLCGARPVSRETTQLYLKLSAMQELLQKYYDDHKSAWTANAQGLTGRYLNEGLQDRAITRNIEWGVHVPKKGWDDKRIYIWAENVLGYLSATKEFCEKTRRNWEDFLLYKPEGQLHYYVHAKDNIPFHTVILPGLMTAHQSGEINKRRYRKPDVIVSGEYVTLAGNKMSKSVGNLLTAAELAEEFDIDMIRFYFLKACGDKKDTNFTFNDFVNVINGELVNNFGNLVNRTLSFAKNKLNEQVKNCKAESSVTEQINHWRKIVCEEIERGNTKNALGGALELVNFGNKLFDSYKPWETIKTDSDKCHAQIFNVITVISNIVRLMEPFIPNACAKARNWLGVPSGLEYFEHKKAVEIGEIEILFARIDAKQIAEKFKKYI